LWDFNEILIFSAGFSKKKFMKIRKVGVESFQADMMQVIVAFHNFMKTPNYRMNFDELCY